MNLSPSNSWWVPPDAAQPCVRWNPFSSKATNASHSGVSDVNILTDHAHQEGHFHHKHFFFFSHRLADTVSTGLRLPGNRLQSEVCRERENWERRAEDREDRMFRVFFLKLRCCVYSFLSFLPFFSSSAIFYSLFFSPDCSTLMLCIIKGHGKKIVASLPFPIPTLSIPPNLSCNAHSFLHIWSISTRSHTPSICL